MKRNNRGKPSRRRALLAVSVLLLALTFAVLHYIYGRGIVVAVDPGHGGSDYGAVGIVDEAGHHRKHRPPSRGFAEERRQLYPGSDPQLWRRRQPGFAPHRRRLGFGGSVFVHPRQFQRQRQWPGA